MEMKKDKVKKDDGRYLIYYSFDEKDDKKQEKEKKEKE